MSASGQNLRLSAMAGLVAASVLMGACVADMGDEGGGDDELGTAQGPDIAADEIVTTAEQAALVCGRLSRNETLLPGQSHRSCNNQYELRVQGDGNVVLLGPGGLRWATYALGAGNRLVMQTDGNLVVYSPSNQPRWHSNTYGNPGAYLAIQDDGNLVIKTFDNRPLWTRLQGSTLNLLNGSFETGSAFDIPAGSTAVSYWRAGGAGVERVAMWQPSHGALSIDLNRHAAGSIETTLTTVPGATYNILFDLAGNPDGGPAVKTMRVTANNGSAVDYTFNTAGKSRGNMGWLTYGYSFRAISSQTVLKFTSLTQLVAFGPVIDNVR